MFKKMLFDAGRKKLSGFIDTEADPNQRYNLIPLEFKYLSD